MHNLAQINSAEREREREIERDWEREREKRVLIRFNVQIIFFLMAEFDAQSLI